MLAEEGGGEWRRFQLVCHQMFAFSKMGPFRHTSEKENPFGNATKMADRDIVLLLNI
jgi:hypothetical protein